jgi:hypothetical protein
MPAVPNVVYTCAKGDTTWAPATFTVDLAVTAVNPESPNCQGEGRTSAIVEITDTPKVTVIPRNPDSAPLEVCQDSKEVSVDVAFVVTTDTEDRITVPRRITFGDQDQCAAIGQTENRECGRRCSARDTEQIDAACSVGFWRRGVGIILQERAATVHLYWCRRSLTSCAGTATAWDLMYSNGYTTCKSCSAMPLDLATDVATINAPIQGDWMLPCGVCIVCLQHTACQTVCQ